MSETRKIAAILAADVVGYGRSRHVACSEREVSASQELSGRLDRGAPGVHRRGAQRAVRWGRGEMTPDAIPRRLFADIMRLIWELRPPPGTSTR
jgi:hypothetical protein